MAEWEILIPKDDKDTTTYRMKVPGGWLYRTQRLVHMYGLESMVFVPEPQGGNHGD